MNNAGSHRIERLDPRFDSLVLSDASLDVLADFSQSEDPHWLEGPVWDRRNGCLLFSDVKANAIYRWDREHGVQLFMQPSGYSGELAFSRGRAGVEWPGLGCTGSSADLRARRPAYPPPRGGR